MAKRGETTLMWGDGPDELPVTSWTLIRNAADLKKSAAERRAIWETLYRLYGRPLYRHLTRSRFSKEKAAECVQDFLIRILKDSAFMSKVDRTKCTRFRSYLLAAFWHHVNYPRRRNRKEHLLNAEELRALEDSSCDKERCVDKFEREENKILLGQMLKEVQTQCRQDRLETHWRVFAERVMLPMLEGSKPPPLSEICRKHGISSTQKASNMIVTVKKRLRQKAMLVLGNRTGSPEGWRKELGDFLDSFSDD